MHAVENGNLQLVKLLVEKGAQINVYKMLYNRQLILVELHH